MAVAIVTDTTHYMPAELVAEHDIHLVSLYVNDGETRREIDITDLGAYYDRLRDLDSLPTTSQPSIGDFLAVYEPLLARGDDILSIHISGAISGTVEAARQAAREAAQTHGEGRIEVFDSASSAAGLAYPALAASAVARAGGDLAACVTRAREMMEAKRIWFAVDTLEYLKRGGRVGAAQAWIGGALKIKPILTLEGEITPIERVRTSGKAFERMLHYARSRHVEEADAWCVQHIRAEERAQELVEACREIYGCDPLYVSEIGPVIGTHIGPGLLGVSGAPPELLR